MPLSASAGGTLQDWVGRNTQRIVPDLIRALRVGRPLELRHPEAVRPWQHVLDPLRGYLLLALELAQDPQGFSGPWNFGPDPEASRTVGELVAMCLEAWEGGTPGWLPASAPSTHHEAASLRLDSTKARERLGWSPKRTFQQSVHETMTWYQAALAGEDVRTLSLEALS